jgi:hypothetical protein
VSAGTMLSTQFEMNEDVSEKERVLGVLAVTE